MNAPQSPSSGSDFAVLLSVLEQAAGQHHALATLQRLIHANDAAPPLPGSGSTLDRWRLFAAIAGHDLCCAKLYESHADALAILHELGHTGLHAQPHIWAVWCAEPPDKRISISSSGLPGAAAVLSGTKAWCSGATLASHALISGWDEEGKQRLVAVDMKQPGIKVSTDGWHAVGMAETGSVNVVFNDAHGTLVGPAGSYVDRPGFHHGGAGIAACWYGAAQAIVSHAHCHARKKPDDPHAMAHLGAMDVALAQAASLLRDAATEIDANPHDPCALAVGRARLAVESAAETILYRTPRALGAGPMCKNLSLARALADLPVFIRQSHAERDQAAHGRKIMKLQEATLWAL
ncbi:MAG: acyl-CoA dehydrogenase family protein [Pusillimonas sp.]